MSSLAMFMIHDIPLALSKQSSCSKNKSMLVLFKTHINNDDETEIISYYKSFIYIYISA